MEDSVAQSGSRYRVRTAFELFQNRQVWVLAFVYFAIACANYTFTFWLPTMLSAAGVRSLASIGWISAIPYGFGIAGALLIARSSDLRQERRWHIACSIVLAAIALASSTFCHTSIALTILFLTLGAFFHFGGGILFWALPPTCLHREMAPAGIAMVSSIGVIGGFISPALLGWIRTATGRLDWGIAAVGALMVAGSVALLLGLPRDFNADCTDDV